MVVNYSLAWYAPGLPVNFAVDSWLTREEWARGVEDGLEIMVWLYNDSLTPGGRHVAAITVTAIVDNTCRELVFDIYRDRRGWDKWSWDFVAFVAREPIRAGMVAIPFGVFVKEALEAANRDPTGLYLEDVEVGWSSEAPWSGRRSSSGGSTSSGWSRWTGRCWLRVAGLCPSAAVEYCDENRNQDGDRDGDSHGSRDRNNVAQGDRDSNGSSHRDYYCDRNEHRHLCVNYDLHGNGYRDRVRNCQRERGTHKHGDSQIRSDRYP
ncbi:GH12 family glycosyl hydrolase domain-containing protein [Pyrodictium abyssi]|uniref:GH12 family glycosyl hydrolase domain-containing protein n=1 Tax=Pyrodictium abyssi TaxID=54256 RepID=UPI0030C692DD